MKNCFIWIVVLSLVMGVMPERAEAGPVVSLNNCYYVNKPNRTTSGRFIWKPVAAHFNQVGIVAPRYYFPVPPVVELLDFDNRLIERARLKTDGRCWGVPECLFAATYLAGRYGSWYQRRYKKGIKVKISGASGCQSGHCACTYYFIRKPGMRAEFYGRQ